MEWASANIGKDNNEEVQTYNNIIDHIKSYLDPERYNEEVKFRGMEKKDKEQVAKGNDWYKNKLLKRGVKVEELD